MFHLGQAGFGAAARLARFPLIPQHNSQDAARQSDRDRIGANERPSHSREAVSEPKRDTHREHHIHGQGQAVRLARADNHDGLGQERRRGEEGGDEADHLYV